MQDWAPNRGCAYDDRFQVALVGLGIAQADFDDLAPQIDEALWGATDEKLNAVYPILADGLRLILTDS